MAVSELRPEETFEYVRSETADLEVLAEAFQPVIDFNSEGKPLPVEYSSALVSVLHQRFISEFDGPIQSWDDYKRLGKSMQNSMSYLFERLGRTAPEMDPVTFAKYADLDGFDQHTDILSGAAHFLGTSFLENFVHIQLEAGETDLTTAS